MIFGHVLSICAMMLLLRPTLRTSRMTSEMFLKAINVDITMPEETEEVEPEQDEDSEDDNSETEGETVDEEWQEDGEIDWEKGVDISEGTDWDGKDSEQEEESD
ncbi:MAG: hypothetical protein ACPGMU_05865 [Candidatus Poseidoniaceae archaeon]